MMIPVCFRIDRRGKHREVTAVFLNTTLNPVNQPNLNRVCYAHLGQHSECSIDWITQNTRPAAPEQLAPLLRELRSIYDVDGDSLDVHRNFTRKLLT